MSYRINDKIKVYNPSFEEVSEYGVDRFFNLLSNLLTTPAMNKYYLYRIGIDHKKMTKFNLFCSFARKLTVDQTSILMGKLDFTKFQLYKNNDTNELALYDEESKVFIDEDTYKLMRKYLKKVFKKQANKQILGEKSNE